MSDRRLGVLLAAGGVLLISLDSLWIRLSEASSWDVVFWVGVFTFVTLSLVVRVRTGSSLPTVVRRDGAPMILSSLLQTASTTFFILAVGATSVSNVVAIIAAVPVTAAVMARLVIGERPTARTWVAIALSVAGILVIVSGSLGRGSVVGDLLAVVAVVAYAGNVTIWRRHAGISRLAVFALSGLIVAVIAVFGADPMGVDATAIVILALMGVVTGPAGRVALASSPRYLPVAQVGLFSPIETVAATAWAWLFLSEAPEATTVVGGTIVIAAVVFGSLQRRAAPAALNSE